MNTPLAPRYCSRSRLAERFLLSLLLLIAVPTAWASVITVAPAAATGSSSGCSLTDAVFAANVSTDATVGNVTVGACTPAGTPGGGGDGYNSGNVIVLAAGSYTFTAPNNYWYGPNALPPIASDIVIVGAAAGSVIERSTASGTQAFRLFYVGGGESLASYNAGNVASGKLPGPGQLTLVNLTVENGLAKGGDSYYGGGGLGAGGAIYNQGTLTLAGMTLRGNEALGGSALTGGDGGGGGIGATAAGSYARGGGFTTALWPSASAASGTFGNGGSAGSNCTTSGCTAGTGQTGGVGGGGGVGGNYGSLSSPGYGGAGGAGGFGGGGGEGGLGSAAAGSGGIGGSGGFGGGGGGSGGGYSNSAQGGFGGGYPGPSYGGGGAGLGGAVFNEGGTVTALNSTLSSNTADGGGAANGGGNGGDGYGGALFNLNGTVVLRYTTLADNAVIGGTVTYAGASPGLADGGAVYNLYLASPGSPAADAASSATMTINSSILSDSTNGSGTSETDCENNAATFTSGYDVVQTPGTCTFNNNDQTADPQLATSAATANGGPTPTLALTSTSPAINNGDTGTTLGPVPTVDQRGYGRDTKPDVGAYEYIFAPTVTGLPATLTVNLGSSVPSQSFSLDGSPPLTVTAASSNATLLPASGITLSSGCGSDTSHYACTLSLTPASGQTGTATVTVKARDPFANTGQQSMNLTVQGVPQVSLSPTPLAFGSVVAGSTTTLTETLKNTGSASLSISGIALGGTNAAEFSQTNACPSSLAVGASCAIQVSYTPNALASASAKLTITSNASSSPDSVILSGTGTDTAPTAIGASVSTPTNQALTGQLQGNANDAGQTLTFSAVTPPAHGSVTVNANGSFSYTPNSGYAGSDSFTFRVYDGYLNSAPATVSITVNDTAPTASNASFSTPLNTAYSGQLQATNPDSGQTLTYSIVSPPSHGTVSITNAATGAYTYTPTSGYIGSDSFTFKVYDGYKYSNTATVLASVTDNPPVAQNGSYQVTANRYVSGQLKATASSPSLTLTYALVSQPAHGTVSVDAGTGQFTYIPTHNYTGTDSFTFKANDGTLDSNTATIELKVAAGALAAHNGVGGGAFGPWGLTLLATLAGLLALLRRKPFRRTPSPGGAKTLAFALGLVFTGSVLFTAIPARAADAGPWYAGVQGNVIKPAGGRNSATAGFKGWTLLFGRHLGTHFALEIDRASYSDYPETLTATANWVNWGLRGLYFPWKSQGAFAPFVFAGAGHQYEYQGDNSELSNNSASLGLGFTSQPWSAPVAIRADIEAQHGFGGAYTDKIFSLGVVFGFGGGASPEPAAAAPAPAAAPAAPPPPPADTDGDSVPDSADQCPGTPSGVSVDSKGCPIDTDGDGVPDYLDRCPNTPAGTPVDTHGCPLQRVIRLKDVHFKTNSSVLSGSDQASLDAAATTLKRYPVLKAEVAGYTDSVGAADYNLSLSAKRAKAVKAYLVAHGISADRLTTRGYGETHPVASNKTAAGRKQNRRVELHIQNLDQLKEKTTVKHQ